ncbi:MAG: DUF308 domain-containing protein [Sphingomonadaceae bacterium]|nr:DUF308 domain-containing protein [Sphingomonadaceae bacterium]
MAIHSSASNRTWLAILGVLSILLGIFGLATAPALTVSATLWLGIALAVVGVVGLINTARRGQRALGFVLGGLYLVSGLAIAFNPLVAAANLTLFIAFWLVAAGLFRLFWGLRTRARALAIPGGLVSVLLGALLVYGWPLTGLFAVGMFVSVDLLLFGGTALAIALMAPRDLGTLHAG